jgi:hypothetical protein
MVLVMFFVVFFVVCLADIRSDGQRGALECTVIELFEIFRAWIIFQHIEY